MKKSIDKCAGDDCACKLAKPVRIFRDLKIESISINHGPSIFPGAGGMRIVSDVPRDHRINERAMMMVALERERQRLKPR